MPVKHVLVILLYCLIAARPVHAQSDIDARWGVLAEMAEHDFAGKQDDPLGVDPGLLSTFRWETRGRVLVMKMWSSKTYSSDVRFELDAATGLIDMKPWSGKPRQLSANAAGELIRTDKNKRFIWKDEKGVFKIFFALGSLLAFEGADALRLRPVDPSSGNGRLLAELTAGGILQRADPAGGAGIAHQSARQPTASQVPAAAPPPAVTSAATAPMRPSTPMTASGKQGPRIALVIGNANYGTTLGSLVNPANDAQLIAAGLRAVGFQVELLLNVDQRSMKQAISRLGQRMDAAGSGSTGLFYYAGHGMQSRGVNYLIPVGAAIQREADIDLEAVTADAVLSQMEEARAATSIVILDACRNTPVASSFRSGTRGLARMEAHNGSFLSYSTAPGSVALDGNGRNSPFAQALSAELQRPGQPIEITFRNVRRTVLEATGGQQTPWDASSLIDSFVFKP